MHLEILPPERPTTPELLVPDLEQGLLEVLRLVEEAVEDWQKMITRSEETIELLKDPAAIDGRQEDAALACELISWLNANHFTFLGYREYKITEDQSGYHMEPVPATGLGILRGDQDAPGAFHALPQKGTRHYLTIVTKDNYKSRIHRPAYLDYLGFRMFDADGNVVGERRFIGLFSSSAYSESVNRVPVIRQKAAAVLAYSGYDKHSHGGKAIMDVLDTYPRDELFQTPRSELAPVVEKIAHLKERRQVRMFVRRDPYGRYLSCLIYLPRDRYTTAVRNRMQDILMRKLGGASIDYTARVSESVLARLHFVLRMPVGEAMGQLDIRALEKELTLATRSWNDEFADQVNEVDNPERIAPLVGTLPEGYKEDYTPRQATQDLAALTALAGDHDMSMAMFVPGSGGRRGRSAAQDLPPGHPHVADDDLAPSLPARGRRDRRAAVRAGARHGQAGLHLRLRTHRAGRRPSGAIALDRRGPEAVHGRVLRFLSGVQRVGRLQRAGHGRRPRLARRERAAGDRPLSATGRRHLQPDLRRPGAQRERRHRPAAGQPLPDSIRPRSRRRRPRPCRPRRRAGRQDQEGARRRRQS